MKRDKEKEKVKEKECCMCGDAGFSRELFQCRTCLYRSQHTYCSCLYPRAESYRECDWCLRNREERKAPKQTMDSKSNIEKPKCTQTDNNGVSQSDPRKVNHQGNQRNCQPGMNAVKKLKSMAEINSLRDGIAESVNRRRDCSSASAKGHKFAEEKNSKEREMLSPVRSGMTSCKEIFRHKTVQISGSKVSSPRLVRGKVRRYKLLEKVSS